MPTPPPPDGIVQQRDHARRARPRIVGAHTLGEALGPHSVLPRLRRLVVGEEMTKDNLLLQGHPLVLDGAATPSPAVVMHLSRSRSVAAGAHHCRPQHPSSARPRPSVNTRNLHA